jgi:hypothetical protein
LVLAPLVVFATAAPIAASMRPVAAAPPVGAPAGPQPNGCPDPLGLSAGGVGSVPNGGPVPNICVTIVPLPSSAPEATCNLSISYTTARGNIPELGGRYIDITMSGEVSCNGGVGIAGRGIELLDRTPGTGCDVNLPPSVPCSLGNPDPINSGERDNAVSSGTVRLYDVDHYPAAQQVEIAFGMNLLASTPFVFKKCPVGDGQRLLLCSPDPRERPTNHFNIAVGTGVFSSGVAPCSSTQPPPPPPPTQPPNPNQLGETLSFVDFFFVCQPPTVAGATSPVTLTTPRRPNIRCEVFTAGPELWLPAETHIIAAISIKCFNRETREALTEPMIHMAMGVGLWRHRVGTPLDWSLPDPLNDSIKWVSEPLPDNRIQTELKTPCPGPFTPYDYKVAGIAFLTPPIGYEPQTLGPRNIASPTETIEC